MNSIRNYLLTRILGGAALLVGLAGVGGYIVVTRALEDQFDKNLVDRVKGFASILFQHADEVEFEFSEELMPEYEKGPLQAFFELSHGAGPLLERSPSLYFAKKRLAGEHVVDWVTMRAASPEDSAATSESREFWTGTMPDGRRGRFVAEEVVVHHVYPEEGPDRPEARLIRVVIALGLEDLQQAQRHVFWVCFAAFGSLLSLIAGLSFYAIKKGLGPARRLAARLDDIEVERLPERFDAGEMPTELRPISDKTDALIRRVEAALEREQRTTADIAHELRTPISELLTVAEVALRHPEDTEGMERALRTARDVSGKMGRSVSTLLKLAWLEMGAQDYEVRPVDLDELIRDILRPLAPIRAQRALDIDLQVDSGATVPCDPEVVRIIVSNLFANALRYSPEGGRVLCRLESGDGADRWRLVVENAAPELRDADLGSLSEPFWRKERSRSDRKHFGLGLALSRALSERAGLQLLFELRDGYLQASLSGSGPIEHAQRLVS